MTDVIAHVKAFVWLNYRVRVVAHPVESLLMLRGQYALICLLWAEYRRNISGVDAADWRMAFRPPRCDRWPAQWSIGAATRAIAFTGLPDVIKSGDFTRCRPQSGDKS